MMVVNLEKENPGLFQRTDSRFIDLYMKSGMYITEVVKKLFANTRHSYQSDAACLKHILENQVYGLAPTGILHDITSNYIFGFDTAHDIDTRNFKQHDLLPDVKDNMADVRLTQLFGNGGNTMRFDAVVGNPPYQETGDARDEPIYHLFYDAAEKIADRYSLISPGRFLFNAGQTPKQWNRKMLTDEHIKVSLYEQDSSKIFPKTDIKGGVAIIYRDKNQNFGSIGTFTHLPELNTIAKKVSSSTKGASFSELVQPQGIYRFSEKFFKTFPQAETMQGAGTKSKIVSKSFTEMDFAFLEHPANNDSVKMLGLVKGKRHYKWINKEYLSLPDSFETWRVILPESNGSGAIGEVLSTPLIGQPLIGHADTFLSVGQFDTEIEAENCMKYIKSKFTRTMLGILKITQHNSRSTWAKVPLQDFTASSDIDWSRSISEIDQQLYRKYSLSNEEIGFIETRVREMR